MSANSPADRSRAGSRAAGSSDEEAEAWLQGADLTEYSLAEMKKVRFELAPQGRLDQLAPARRAARDAEGARGQGQHADAAHHPHDDRDATQQGKGKAEAQA